MEEAASRIDCQETKLDKALEEIIEKEKAATDARSLKDDNKKTEKAAAEEHRNRAVERLGETKKRNARNKTKKPRRRRKEEDRRRKWEKVNFRSWLPVNEINNMDRNQPITQGHIWLFYSKRHILPKTFYYSRTAKNSLMTILFTYNFRSSSNKFLSIFRNLIYQISLPRLGYFS